MSILTWSCFYIYITISVLGIRTYVRFAEIWAKSEVSGKCGGTLGLANAGFLGRQEGAFA